MVTTCGIQNKPVTVITSKAKCDICGGSGLIPTGKVEASKIKGLKVSGVVDIHMDCECGGNEIPFVVKKIKLADRIKKHQPIVI